MHAVGDAHDTALSVPLPAVGWMVQVLPSQRSASGAPLLDPTAVHAVAEVHDTPKRLLVVAPLGLGVGCIVQALPSHRSARVT
jgi:hypothetical protein